MHTDFIGALAHSPSTICVASDKEGIQPSKNTNMHTEQHYREQLQERKNRLEMLKRDGVKALSRYDIEIASGGDAQLALATAISLVRNRISYLTDEIEEARKRILQLRLF